MKASSLIVASLVAWAGIASAQNITVTTTVNGTQGPWNWVAGGLNTSYQYGLGNEQPPTVITANSGIGFSSGLNLTISYVSGLMSLGPSGGWPYTDANGDLSHEMDTNWYGGWSPAYFMNPATYPTHPGELVGTFANSGGQIVGTPFAIGDLGTFTIPTGATQLQLGVNSVGYGTSVGSWNIQVTQTVPEPTTTALVFIGLGGSDLRPAGVEGASFGSLHKLQ
jgi:hypothetical protein